MYKNGDKSKWETLKWQEMKEIIHGYFNKVVKSIGIWSTIMKSGNNRDKVCPIKRERFEKRTHDKGNVQMSWDNHNK